MQADSAQHEQVVLESAARATAAERRELRARVFARHAAIVCLLLCMVGVIALSICMAGGFNLQMGGAKQYEVTHRGGGTWALVRPSYDLTTLFAGLATAGFASALIVCGGALGQVKRMPQGSVYAVGISALVSTVGLLVLAFAG